LCVRYYERNEEGESKSSLARKYFIIKKISVDELETDYRDKLIKLIIKRSKIIDLPMLSIINKNACPGLSEQTFNLFTIFLKIVVKCY